MTVYSEYPHTNYYDEDLGFLIRLYKELIRKYEDLIFKNEEIRRECQEIINQLFADGKLSISTKYIEATTTLKFIVERTE